MNWLHTVSYFFGGRFLANVVPHFVSGIMEKPFQTPFAKPPGKGLSSSTVNVLWGFTNFAFAYLLPALPSSVGLRIISARDGRSAWARFPHSSQPLSRP
jgi:hypothetical protein